MPTPKDVNGASTLNFQPPAFRRRLEDRKTDIKKTKNFKKSSKPNKVKSEVIKPEEKKQFVRPEHLMYRPFNDERIKELKRSLLS